MRILRLAPVLFLFIAFGSQVPIPNQAYAWCCGCICMWGSCTCPGYWDNQAGRYCYYCSRSIEPVQQAKASVVAETDIEKITSVRDINPMIVAQSEMIQRVTELRMRQGCQRDRVAFSLLGRNRDSLKFELWSLNEKRYDQIVALQVDTDK